jgi:TetR/AcrR family transcriptional regulator
MPRRPAGAEPDSHHRLLDAALQEFASRGFAGARVDRIARNAQVNKAMLYYHFGSKIRLYRAALEAVLGRLVARLEAVAAGPGSGPDKLDAFIDTFVAAGLDQPTVAPLMLREVAEGAAHLDRHTFGILARVAGAMVAIVEQGRTEGAFRQVDPLLTYLTTAWPIMIYLAAGPLREKVGRHTSLDTTGLEPSQFIRHMQDMGRRALAVPARPSRPATSVKTRSRGHAS